MNLFITENLKSIMAGTLEFLEPKDLVKCQSYRSISHAIEAYPFKDSDQQLIKWQKGHYFTFMGNPILFVRIMFNLLDNALYQIQTNSRGEIFISTAEQDNYNIISFKDTAGGASAEVVKRMFDGYYTTKPQGTGVGLAFCQLTMKSFGGIIECDSVEGEYIEFILKFPKIISQEE